MKICNFLKKNFIFFLPFLFLTISYEILIQFPRPKVFISKQDSTLNLNYQFLNIVNVGHKRLISSLFWISTILESDITHYKQKDLNSWMFLRFNTISKLEPKFLTNYTFGGLYLSVIKDDLEGASSLYLTGLKNYPNDYDLLKTAGYHFYFEVEDYAHATEVFRKLKNFPNLPFSIRSTISRLEAQDGDLSDAYAFLKESLEKAPANSDLRKKISTFLYAIKAEIDLTCLNNSKSNCKHDDFYGNKYMYKDGNYIAVNEWVPFRIKKKKSKTLN
jgi:tetratricopeptide (TPR) repeat protein